jgi:hypothetical protein
MRFPTLHKAQARDEEKLRARDALQKRVDVVLAELEREAENSG